MRRMARWSIAFLCLACACCGVLPRRRIDAVVLSPPAAGSRWAIGAIDIEGSPTAVDSRASLEEMLRVIAIRQGLPLDAGHEAPVMLDIRVTEHQFSADLVSRSSISFSATLRERATSTTLARALLTEESGGTTESLYYLQGLADMVLRRLVQELARGRPEG